MEQWNEFDEANIEGEIVRQRQEDINQIDRLMNEVNSMVKDMANEVENADVGLEQIASNARSAKNDTKKALVDIHKGSQYQKKSYKMMYIYNNYRCCIVWLIIVCLLVVGLVIYFTFR